MDTGFAIFICFILGALTAYMDIASFFREKKVGVSRILTQFGALLFIVANGLIGLGFLVWALSDPAAKINGILPVESAISKGLVIGLSIPILIRSKWFSIKQDGTSPAGIEAIYQWARISVLHRVHRESLGIKRGYAGRFAVTFEGNQTIPDRLLQNVLAEVEPFRSPDELEDLNAEYANITSAYADQAASKEHLREIFLWALDNCGLGSADSLLEDLKGDEGP